MDEDIVGIIAMFLIVFVPVAGITARIAFKPLIDALAKAIQARQGNEAMQLMERRLALLEQELQSVRGEVHQLSDERDFYRKLAAESEQSPRIGA